MPELPEVETVRRITEPQTAGRKILSAELLNEKIIAHPSAGEFTARLAGRTFAGMGRRGKFLLFDLDDGSRLVLHLRMTGQLLVTPAEYPMEKHTHAVFRLSDGMQMRYTDVRRFGRFWLLGKDEEDAFTGMQALGIEPDDSRLTAGYLRGALGRRKKAVKEALLDQGIVCGIGNIYADEILFAARICPEKPCCELTAEELERLAREIPAVIAWGIEANRTTPEEYLLHGGREYRNMPLLKVYGREGKPCAVCGTPLACVTLGGRSSCFCPECQKNKEMF